MQQIVYWIAFLCSAVMCKMENGMSCEEQVCTVAVDMGIAERFYVDSVILQNEEKPDICKTGKWSTKPY